MPNVSGGTRIRKNSFAAGAAGCLVQFSDERDKVLLLTAEHVLVDKQARQGDLIRTDDSSAQSFGRLLTWTSFDGDTTVDAALVWVDPSQVLAEIPGIGAPNGVNLSPAVGDRVTILCGGASGAPRSTRIAAINQAVNDVTVLGPDWSVVRTYRNQILCSPMVTDPGDSGSIVLDAQNRVVGMVVVDWEDQNATVITPFEAIQNHASWLGSRLEVLSAVPQGATPPGDLSPLVKAIDQSNPQGKAFASLTLGGFFSDDPDNMSVPRSIRTNNPGALNYTSWQASRPGFVGKTQPDGSVNHNVTTVYRTPEHGVASWFSLLSDRYGFVAKGSFTLTELAHRYSGQEAGPAVDGYLKGWRAASQNQLSATSSTAINNDQQMLVLGRAMFRHEAGKPSPLTDEQILFGIQHERDHSLPG